MNPFFKSSISTKLKAIIVLVSCFILTCATIFNVFNEYKILENDLKYNSELNAKLIGEFCVYPLLFDDAKGSYEVLCKSESIQYIFDITIYDTTSNLFARFEKKFTEEKAISYKKPLLSDSVYFEENVLNVIKPIYYQNIKYGFIHLRSSYKMVNDKIYKYIILMSALLLITLIVTYFLASKLQKIISKPILNLAKLTNEISISGNYSQQLEIKATDEIGILYREFNNMLRVINQRNNERELQENEILKLNEELEEKVAKRTRELQIEKEKTQALLNKSDKLLLNVLPESIATRLKSGETQIADHFGEASVVFIDIVDFTKSSADADPKSVLQVLNVLYSKLDNIAQKHGLEKIKTIGDCYMAAAGVPEIRKDNAEMAAHFALEAMLSIKNYDTGNNTFINFRCGIDCGPLVAGVIGENKFIYDIWGDTVNTAARMEEYSEPGRIQVTERFKEKLTMDNGQLTMKEKNNYQLSTVNFQFLERGEIEIKGKGKMRTYFLEKIS